MKIPSSHHATRVTLLYFIVAGLWILLADRLLAEFIPDPGLRSGLQTLKGWVFLGLTAVWLYLALRSEQQTRDQVQAKLKAVEEEQLALFAAMTDVVIVLDAQRRFIKIESANPAQWPQPPAELIGRTLGEVLPPRPAEAFRTHIQQALETRQPV